VTGSILDETKKLLGLDASYTAFDTDVIMHINTVFSTLTQLGIGPDTGYMITDNTATWDAFIGTTDPTLNAVKSYLFMKVKMMFDPPQTSFVIEAYNKNIQELEWRLNVKREGVSWTDPNPPAPTPDPETLDWCYNVNNW
jgi:hypothetical protein